MTHPPDPQLAPPGAPTWFADGLREPVETGRTEVDGAGVAWVAWGRRSDPTMVLVHGGAAHARWWTAVAPSLARHHRVVALDLSGHGDSDHRSAYDATQWAEEVLAVGQDAGGTGRPLVVGHSMGGLVVIALAAAHGPQLAGAVVLDAPVRRPDPETEEGQIGRMFRAPKRYPDLETALAHFHLVPPQPCENDWLLRYIGAQSLRPGPDGWSWKFDPGVFSARRGPSYPEVFGPELARAGCRVAIVNGERSSIVDEDVRAHMTSLLADSPAAAAGVPVLDVPFAHHHLLLDQPLAVVTAIRGVVAAWRPLGRAPDPVPAAGPG